MTADDRSWAGYRGFLTEEMRSYRSGTISEWTEQHALAERRAKDVGWKYALHDFRHIPVLPGRWPGYSLASQPAPQGVHLDSIGPYRPGDTPDDDPQKKMATDRAGYFDRALQSVPGGKIKFVKVLGYGGLGVAMEWEVDDGDGSGARRVVAKVCLDERYSAMLNTEKGFHRYLNRARHVVQEEMVGKAARARAKRRRGDEAAQEDESDLNELADILFLEYMPRGSLQTWMKKVNGPAGLQPDGHARFSNKMLWLFAHCLAKGVAAMAYPPKKYEDYEQTGGKDGFAVDERAPATEEDYAEEKMVHFDLDPTNILVGYNDTNGGHIGLAPILKIGDFGLSEFVYNKFDDRFKMGDMRRFGKRYGGCLAPEQFHPEWDYIPNEPKSSPSLPKIAGKFSYKSNVYHIGLILHNLITLSYAPDKPYPTPLSNADGTQTRWHYAAFLDHPKYDHVDQDLKTLVQNCMMDDPAHRPDIPTLLFYCDQKIKLENWPDESDEQTVAWSSRLFATPGAPFMTPFERQVPVVTAPVQPQAVQVPVVTVQPDDVLAGQLAPERLQELRGGQDKDGDVVMGMPVPMEWTPGSRDDSGLLERLRPRTSTPPLVGRGGLGNWFAFSFGAER